MSPVTTLKRLGRLKALQNMSSTDLLERVNIAVQHTVYHPTIGWQCPVISWSSTLAAARNVPADAASRPTAEGRPPVCPMQLPCTKACRCSTLLQLLNKVVQLGSDKSLDVQRKLCAVAAELQLNSNQLTAFMLAAMNNGEEVRQFGSSTRGAKQWNELTSDNVAELLTAAVKHNHLYSVETLSKLPAARNISSASLAESISAALDGRGDKRDLRPLQLSLRILRSLPAAQQIAEDTAAAIFSKAEQSGGQ